MTESDWHFWIDRGGTFTDIVARDPQGQLHLHKLLSRNPERYADPALQGIHDVLEGQGIDARAGLPLGTVKMGTTLATNALLERTGVPVALVVTAGFADLLRIGYQERPDLFALHIKKHPPLARHTIEAGERMCADGTVRQALLEDSLRAALAKARAMGIDAVAILFLHSYANPAHEIAAGRIAQELGFTHISLSHDVANEIKAVGRGDTTVADAYLTPLLRDYVDHLQRALGDDVALRFMQSNGGLTDARRFRGKNAVLSGPAGGVVACAHLAGLAGVESVIGFDMGGTSTDISRYGGRFERSYETRVAGVRLKAPMMHIETVAAGGGSILCFEQGRYTVGPASAGADPGPACYRRGGPATVTDANLVLGRIQPEYFPACFGPGGDAPLDPAAAYARLAELAAAITEATGIERSVEETAAGFIRIANEHMAEPIKTISIARGYDPQDHALVCFGGAGAQHACALAARLGMRRILLHPLAGVLSAYGMGLADALHTSTLPVLETWNDATLSTLEPLFQKEEATGLETLHAEGVSIADITHERSLDLRYQGVEATLNIPLHADTGMRDAFEAAHQQLYGFIKPEHPIEVVALRVDHIGHTRPTPMATPAKRAATEALPTPIQTVRIHFDGVNAQGVQECSPVDTPIYERAALRPGDDLAGPAMVVEATSTIVIDPGWDATVDAQGMLVLTPAGEPQQVAHLSETRDPILLEVFNNLFQSIATQMGKTLERVSHSANIKERLDFSCALFGPGGALVANAPHIPVHLGAMGESVRAVLVAHGGTMQPGDVYVTNDPYQGGSHLPDITVVSPVFSDTGERIFLVANRGHHADIGGIVPGSMPPFSRTIEDEGVVLRNLLLVRDGQFREQAILAALGAAPYPARNLPERLSDLHAQVAANAAGAEAVAGLCACYGTRVVQAYMQHVRDNAAEAMRARIAALPDGTRRFEDQLDCGARICCTITITGDTAHIDFAGTSPQLNSNLNAPAAVTLSAVLYVLRTLIDEPIPLNEGCLAPVTVHIPPGSLLSPEYPAAVAGGNVETSQRICDVLYGALGVVAASQGTMNNFTFGNERFGYYETICGGAGAGPGHAGADAVHTHMTNTRITDPEILERRYPVLLRNFALRHGSGGAGKWPGGNGVVRTLEFRDAMQMAILSERRATAPYGLDGGGNGCPGRNTLLRASGEALDLGGHAQIDVAAGDAIVIETPGGGGYGAAAG